MPDYPNCGRPMSLCKYRTLVQQISVSSVNEANSTVLYFNRYIAKHFDAF